MMIFPRPACGTTQRLPGQALGAYLQHRAIVEVVGTGPSFQGWKGHVAPGERRNVAELICAQGLLLVASRADEAPVCLRVGVLAGAAVVLVRDPGPIFPRALVNGEALRAAGVELEAHVCDVKCFSCWGKHVDVCKSCGWSEEPSAIPTLLWNSTKKGDTNHPMHTRLRVFQNARHVGCARQAILSLETVFFPTDMRYGWAQKLACKSPFMMYAVEILLPMKTDSIYYVLILWNESKIKWKSAFYPQCCCFYKSLIERQKRKYLLAFFWVLPRFSKTHSLCILISLLDARRVSSRLIFLSLPDSGREIWEIRSGVE